MKKHWKSLKMMNISQRSFVLSLQKGERENLWRKYGRLENWQKHYEIEQRIQEEQQKNQEKQKKRQRY